MGQNRPLPCSTDSSPTSAVSHPRRAKVSGLEASELGRCSTTSTMPFGWRPGHSACADCRGALDAGQDRRTLRAARWRGEPRCAARGRYGAAVDRDRRSRVSRPVRRLAQGLACPRAAATFRRESVLVLRSRASARARQLVEVRPKPALRLLERDAAASSIFLELVAADPRDAEILAVAVTEVEA